MNDHYSLAELKRVLHLTKDDRDDDRYPVWVKLELLDLKDYQSARERYEAIEQAEAQQPRRVAR